MIAIAEDLDQQVGLQRACAALDVAPQHRVSGTPAATGAETTPIPSNALPEAERAEVRQTLNSERFMDKAPRQVYATLLDEGHGLVSLSMMYRVLSEHDEVETMWTLPVDGAVLTNLSAVSLPGGGLALAVGLIGEDGQFRLRVWR